jgi:ketosteroid isomerase-like protein
VQLWFHHSILHPNRLHLRALGRVTLQFVSYRIAAALLLTLPCWSRSPTDRIRQLITNYAAAVDAADIKLAARVWDTSSDVTFIHPLGEANGWTEIQAFLTDIMGGMFSARKLVPRDIKVHVYGAAAWSEFNWHFTATQRKDGALVQTDGRETQIYRKRGASWVLVHAHYSAIQAVQ